MQQEPPFFLWGTEKTPAQQGRMRQTLMYGGLPWVVVLIFMLAYWPRLPGPEMCSILGACAGLEICLWGFWRMEDHEWRRKDWFPRFHFLVHYIFLCSTFLLLWWMVALLELPLTGWQTLQVLCLLALWPLAKWLAESVQAFPIIPPAWEMGEHVVGLVRLAIGAWWVVGLINAVILELNRDYPTDPITLLILFWAIGGAVTLACLILGVGHWVRLFGHLASVSIPDKSVSGGKPKAETVTEKTRSVISFGSDRF